MDPATGGPIDTVAFTVGPTNGISFDRQ